MGITWPTAIAIIGTAVAFFGFIYKMWKKPEEQWKDDLITIEHKIHTITTCMTSDTKRMDLTDKRIDILFDMIEDLKDDLEKHESHDDSTHKKLHSKVEKLTDLMIEMIQDKH